MDTDLKKCLEKNAELDRPSVPCDEMRCAEINEPVNGMPHVLAKIAAENLETFRISADRANVLLPQTADFWPYLKQIFSLSDFVAQTCIGDPKILADLIHTGDLTRTYSPDDYISKLELDLKALESAPTVLAEGPASDCQKSGALLQQVLRRFRKREMVRIACRDLAGWADLFETMADMTAFAEACIEHTLNRLYRWACAKSGTPVNAKGLEQHLVVIGMGKLGGQELNFSSDIDLIFAYPEGGETQGHEPPIANEEFFTQLSRALLTCLGAVTPDGPLFRVDMRLRPFGDNGPLIMSFDRMEDYYQTQGRNWERYAWIKARIVAGDIQEGARLLDRLKPFVYRRYLDFGTFEALRDMKQRISSEVTRRHMAHNVKLGPGGIREIEFFGQIFQLIRGGVLPVLQNRRILDVLDVLHHEKIVPETVCTELADAYVFLRNTEHRLQEFGDQQTHDIPSDVMGKTRLAASMGFLDWTSFAAHFAGVTRKVHRHFSELLETKDDTHTSTEKHSLLLDIWQAPFNSSRALAILSDVGFESPNDVLQILLDLKNDPEMQKLGREGLDRLDRLIPTVLEKIGRSRNQTLVLNRLIHLIRTIARRACYLSLLLENPTVLDHLIQLATASPWIISFLSSHPVLLDELIDPRTVYVLPDRFELARDLRHRLAHLPESDFEFRMETLCIFKQISTLQVAAADIRGSLALMKVSDHLTFIAETILEEVLELSWRHLITKHGRPNCVMNERLLDQGFVVIAYGKLGGFELSYSSDLDLVFLHAGAPGQSTNGPHPIDSAMFFSRLGQRVIHILTMNTPAGVLYETDLRLRPSGSSGLLVSSIASFEDYQKNRAWTWEHQALIKARPVCGDAELAERFKRIRSTVLSRSRDKNVLQKEVSRMRTRLRLENEHRDPDMFDLAQGLGGMVDIEFLVQYLVLLNAGSHSELLKWPDNVRLLETLASIDVIDGDTASFLIDAYLAYRRVGHRQKLQEKQAVVTKNDFLETRRKVVEIWRDHIESDA